MNDKDWTGDYTSMYRVLGASNHCEDERAEHDFYATPRKATELLLELETFDNNIWECAAGTKLISEVLEQHGYDVRSSDIIDRTGDIEIFDFLQEQEHNSQDCDIITNPPYKYAAQFVEQAMDVITDGHKVAMFLKITFLEGKKRRKLFEKYPPKIVYVATSRLACLKNGNEYNKEGKLIESGAVCFCWFIWEKGFKGDPIIKWFN